MSAVPETIHEQQPMRDARFKRQHPRKLTGEPITGFDEWRDPPDRVPTLTEATDDLKRSFLAAITKSPYAPVRIPSTPAISDKAATMTITDLIFDRLGGVGTEERRAALIGHLGRLMQTDSWLAEWVDREAEDFATWHASDAVIEAEENAT